MSVDFALTFLSDRTISKENDECPPAFRSKPFDVRSPFRYDVYESWGILAATFLGTCFSKIRSFNHEFKA